MIISTVPILHKIKHQEPIFTIHRSPKYFATGGINGEMKLWNSAYKHVKTVKKHTGSIASIRFSTDGRYVASAGDDGRVYIFDSDAENVIHTVKHSSDVTNIEWSADFLFSVDLDGFLIVTRLSDFSTALRVNNHHGSITGLCVSPDYHYACTYSEGILVLYKDLVLVKTLEIEKGIIMESLNSRLSFAPNSKFISVGLQFNQKSPTVDIFDTSLTRAFSLIGHAAPTEITAFCPLAFRHAAPRGHSACYYIIALASQDLSISLWSTASPRPFLLVKNFTEAPVLDLCWDGTTLYASSYDGIVKKLVFAPGELGEVTAPGEEEEEFELPFSTKNIELQKSRAARRERPDLNEKIARVPLGDFVINDQKLEEIIEDSRNKKPAAGAPNNASAAKDSKTNERAGATENAANSKTANAKKDEETAGSVAGNDPNANRLTITDGTNIKPNAKRLTPVMLERDEKVPVVVKSTGRSVVLFDTSIPERLRLAKTEPFKQTIGDFLIELNAASTKLTVQRNMKPFYAITALINKVCFNEKFLVVFTAHVQAYDLATGCLLLPYILVRAAYVDLMGDRLLIVNCSGDFSVVSLGGGRTRSGRLPRTKGLQRVALHGRYYILAEYTDGTVCYNKEMGLWMALDPPFNSITTAGTDFYNDTDETLSQLESSFANYRMFADQPRMRAVAKQFVGAVKRMGRLDSATEYKLAAMLRALGDKELVHALAEEMNEEVFLQRFVEKLLGEYE